MHRFSHGILENNFIDLVKHQIFRDAFHLVIVGIVGNFPFFLDMQVSLATPPSVRQKFFQSVFIQSAFIQSAVLLNVPNLRVF